MTIDGIAYFSTYLGMLFNDVSSFLMSEPIIYFVGIFLVGYIAHLVKKYIM